ncbi:MAG: transposase [Proteobacteria bacterium]|nr:transposase [Pseudomonadota bacterium]
MKNTDFETPAEALFRYQVISQVLGQMSAGKVLSKSVKSAADMEHVCPNGKRRKISKRSIYRWLDAFKQQGFEGLLPKPRQRTRDSIVLSRSLLDFLVEQKTDDPLVSVPELINRGKILGHIHPRDVVNRVTVWRALNRLGIDTSHRKSVKNRDSRRFTFPHRMDMVLCDGKHFRAGINRLRRVVLFFLDDCTRNVLNAVVGTSETTRLFLRGLYQTIKTYGFMSAVFVDQGSGFASHDAVDVLRKLDILFIHGAKGYPQGRGKIERFNRTAFEQAIRFFNGNPEVDADCRSLEQRLRHYIACQYANAPHERLGGQSPLHCFQNDARSLRFAESIDRLRQAFVLHTTRRVSFDNVVSLKSIEYEVPTGYAGARITLHRNPLDDSISIVHQGRLVRILPVDLHSNAHDKRAAGRHNDDETKPLPPKSCSQIAYERDFKPVVDPDGGFAGRTPHLEQEDES